MYIVISKLLQLMLLSWLTSGAWTDFIRFALLMAGSNRNVLFASRPIVYSCCLFHFLAWRMHGTEWLRDLYSAITIVGTIGILTMNANIERHKRWPLWSSFECKYMYHLLFESVLIDFCSHWQIALWNWNDAAAAASNSKGKPFT